MEVTTRAALALAAVLAAGAVSAQEVAPPPPPRVPTTPPAAPPGSGMAPAPRYADVVHPFELRPGDRIRVWDTAGTLVKEDGTVVGADHEGIAATLDGQVRLLKFDDIKTLHMRRGSGRPWLGALIGFVVGSSLYALRDDESNDPPVDYLILTGTFAAMGAITANYVARPDWRPVEMLASPTGPQTPKLRPQARGPSAGLRIALRF
jgi:hypothetical protein